jgi:hypothetical protein
VPVIVPVAALPFVMPLTLHVTAVFEVPVTVAVNCCVALIASETRPGATVTPVFPADVMVTVDEPV